MLKIVKNEGVIEERKEGKRKKSQSVRWQLMLSPELKS